jgi:hypothetical protein
MSIISKNIENLKPNKEYIVTVRAKNNDINVLSGYTDSVRFRTPTDSTIPEAPTGLVLAASFLNVLFKYTDSVDEDTAKYEYELYKDDQIEVVGGLNSIISGEIPHRTGFVQTNVFLVSVDDNSTTTSTSSVTNPVKYYGRVRSIDSSENIGGWTNIVASGDTPLIDEEFIGSLTAAKITAGTIGAHEIILTQPGTATTITSPDNKAILRSSDYNGSYNNATDTWSAGSTGWIISGDGRAEFNNATIRGTLQFIDGSAPGSIYYGATQPSIPSPFTAKLISAISGNGTSVTYTTGTTAHGLSVGKIISLNHVIPSQYNLKNQYVTAVTTFTFTVTSTATGTFDPIYSIGAEVVAGQIPEFSIWYNSTSGDNKSYIYSSSAWNQSLANVSNLNPQNQTQTGLIAGTTITGGGITLTTGGNIKGGQTDYNTGTGFFLGYSGTTHKFSIGNSGGNKLTWDGNNLSVTGEINASSGTFSGSITASGTITGGTISGATVTGGSLSTTDNNLRLAANAFNNGLASGTVASLRINNSTTAADTSTITPGVYFQDPSNSAIFSKIAGNSHLGEYYLNINSPRTNSGPTLDYSNIVVSSTGIFQNFRDINGNKWTSIGLQSGSIVIQASNSSSSLSYGLTLTESIFSIYTSSHTSLMQENNATSAGYLRIPCSASNTAITTFAKAATSYHMTFHSTLNAVIGTIRTDNSRTYYDETSDYRLKENINPINNAVDTIKNLNPVYFNFKTDQSKRVSGFIAHEVQSVMPEMVHLDKDALKEDGSPDYQGLDYSKFTPILTAAVKEIIERLEVLENK